MSLIDKLKNIMQEENSAVAVTDLNRWILNKADSEGYKSLSMEEKVIVHVNALDWELTNRGVNRLIFGSPINYAEEMTECLRRVGAQKTAECFDEFLSLIPNRPLPGDMVERETYFRSLSDLEIDNLGLGIQKISSVNEDLFTLLCGYFDSVRDRLVEQ